MLYDYAGNLHIHTVLSDGTGTHAQVAAAARRAGLAWCIVTDHNAIALHEQGWRDGVLLLIGQELHAPANPDCNHLLVLGANTDLASTAADPAEALAQARAAGGLCLLAHPYEHSGAFADEPEINWERWDLAGQAHGLELWNYMSEFKAHLPNALAALALAFWPKLGILGPYEETLARWDALLAQGPCIAVGGSDAHAGEYSLGPLKRRVFAYERLFRAVNTHALLTEGWSGDAATDAANLLAALRAGRCYIAYDGLGNSSGFQFALHLETGPIAPMGTTLAWPAAGMLQACTPARARLELWHDGHVLAAHDGRALAWRVRAPGVYRLVARKRYAGRWRAWLLSNAIRIVA